MFTEVEKFFRQNSNIVMHSSPQDYIANQYQLFKLGFKLILMWECYTYTKKMLTHMQSTH